MGKDRTADLSVQDLLGAGAVLCLLGVFISVFANTDPFERMITISIILLFYFIISGVWSFSCPGHILKWGLLLSMPGILFLAGCLRKGFNPYYLLYMVLIFFSVYLGGLVGSKIRGVKSKKAA
jgi:hypothetical protein